MPLLPRTTEPHQDLLGLLIAIPLSLAGTGFILFLLDAGSRLVA